MARDNCVRRLIVTADDFGASSDINHAVRQAHEQGVLTSASLMVGGEAFAEAVEIARELPALAVGLHLTLVCGRAVLPQSELSALVREDGTFSDDPVQAGWQYFRNHGLKPFLENEITAQLNKFLQTGLPLDHVNGHLHLHMHPVVLEMILRLTPPGVPLRLTRDWFWFNARLSRGRWIDRSLHALVFHFLARRAEFLMRTARRRFTPVVFGLLQHGRVDESYLARLLPRLPSGDSELYSHPSLHQGRDEWQALMSPKIQRLIKDQNIQLICYQDL